MPLAPQASKARLQCRVSEWIPVTYRERGGNIISDHFLQNPVSPCEGEFFLHDVEPQLIGQATRAKRLVHLPLLQQRLEIRRRHHDVLSESVEVFDELEIVEYILLVVV